MVSLFSINQQNSLPVYKIWKTMHHTEEESTKIIKNIGENIITNRTYKTRTGSRLSLNLF